jgi:hypothetical protein
MTTATAATETLLTAAATTESGTSAGTEGQTPVVTGDEKPATEAVKVDGVETTTEAAPGTEGKEGEVKTEEKTPVEYDFTFADNVSPDDGTITELKGLAAELQLTPEQAQKIADLGAKQAVRWAENAQTMHVEAVQAWTEAAQADPDIGGAKFAENLAIAKQAFDQFGTPALKQLLDESGLGNHPEIIRWAYKAAKALSDDVVIPGDRDAQVQTDKFKTMFPNSNMN